MRRRDHQAARALLTGGVLALAPGLAAAAPEDEAAGAAGAEAPAPAPAAPEEPSSEPAPAEAEPPAPAVSEDAAVPDDVSEEAEPEADAEPVKPPRISGTYLGMTIWPALSWAYSPNMEIDQSAVIPGGGGALRLGQAVFPWLTLGVDASGGFYFNEDTFFMKGGLLIEAGFYPVPKYPFSIRTGFGFGAGLILDDRTEVRGGVGGPRFMGSVRYEFFPGAERKRPKRAGGWVVGPELGWRGFTPASRGRPMSNTLLLGIWFGYYWGE